MAWFDYPLDTKALLRKKRRIKRELLAKGEFLHKKVAVLGGSTTNEVVEQLDIFLLHNGIQAEFYQSEYAQYWQDAVFGTEELDKFAPDIIYIHTSWRNIERFPCMADTKEQVSVLLDREYHRFAQMWERLNDKFHCPIIQNNFDRPNYRLLGNRDIWDYRGKSNYISRLNQLFYEYAQEHDNFFINDLEYISQDFGISEWNSSLYWHMYKYAMCMEAVPYVAKSVADIIKAIYGKNKKVLVLDLDNTLWGGIVGDDGVEGIVIGPETPMGEVYAEFQEYCKALKDIGVILAVNSKNEMDNALAGLNHPDGILRPDDFVSIKANWHAKDKNIRDIATELNLGLDSLVFVDDNPAEREIVSVQLAEVAVPAMDKAENYVCNLDHSGYFEVVGLSKEDLNKTKMYRARTEASKAMTAFADYGDYLNSLSMKAIIYDFKPIYVQRVAQLTNKSNQFNLTTLRCTEEDIISMQKSENFICLCARLIDKFADNGIVSIVACEIVADELHVRLWLMSCRVLKRELENTMMNVLAKHAQSKGLNKIIGYYSPTAKNHMVKDFYKKMGYKKIFEDDNENTVWELNLQDFSPYVSHMEVEDTIA